MLFCNSLIIYNIKCGSKVQSKNKSNAKRKQRMTIMLVIVTCTFIMLTLPSVIVHTFLRQMLSNKPYRRLVNLTVNNLLHTSHAINFLLYVFSAPNFRIEIVNVLSEVFGIKLGGSQAGATTVAGGGTFRANLNREGTVIRESSPSNRNSPMRDNLLAVSSTVGGLTVTDNCKTTSSYLIAGGSSDNLNDVNVAKSSSERLGGSNRMVRVNDEDDESSSDAAAVVTRVVKVRKPTSKSSGKGVGWMRPALKVIHSAPLDSSLDEPCAAADRLIETSFKK
jgi:hypothetical protein